MELMATKPQRDQNIHFQEILHGKFARSSSTCSLVRIGESGPVSRTGRPLTGSMIMRAFLRRVFLGVRTTLPFEVFTSKESPGRRPNLRRTEAGSLIWPFVDTL